ncbi:hypothetical protein HPB50_027312 [Hyalomma asiaticum]|uniref:Uncharacterized protein n=1 Tax=Hyalomma asiaticum TaxID=266040 RepID=A0ACB7SAI0_HYAAI|nr:hypothetical protein HPB50_027312 [Hyalomma asiaticum]
MASGGAAGVATLEKLLPLASTKNASAKVELEQKIQELPATERGSLCKAVFDHLKTTVLQVMSEERVEDECLPFLILCHAALKADTFCNGLTNAAHFLSGVMPLLEEGELLNSIHDFCVEWCTKKLDGWKDLWLNTFIRSVQLSLRTPKKTEKLVASVVMMKYGLGKDKDGLDAVELDPDDCKALYEQLAHCAVSPNYLSIAKVLEENIQEIMHWAVNGDLTTAHHENLFKFLSVLHAARKYRPLGLMLCRAYQPILWRGLQSLLSDARPEIRVLAVKGVLKLMTDFYEMFPVYQRKSFSKVLIEKNAEDKNSPESRVQVNLFWEQADPKVLLALMAMNKPRLSLQVATLLRNSYFNPDAADRRQNLERCLLLYNLNPSAFNVFYSQLTHIAPLKPIVEFLITVCKVLLHNTTLFRKTCSKENLLPDELAGEEVNDTEVYKNQKPLEERSVHILVETLAVTYSSLSMQKDVTSDSLGLQISVLSAASLLPRDEASNLALRCFSMLRSFLTVPNNGAQLVLSEEAKQCVLFMCNMHRAADVLALVVESVEELQNKQTPVKQRRVRFCVERRPCNPLLGLQVLRQLLESPHLQVTLLKHHTVPLFDTWSVLLRIAVSVFTFPVPSWLCSMAVLCTCSWLSSSIYVRPCLPPKAVSNSTFYIYYTEDTAGVSAEVWSELAEFLGAIDGSTFDEFVSADDDVAIMGQLQDEDYVAGVVPTTSQSDSNKEIDDGPLPTSSEVISALALVQRYCVNMEGCGLSCSDSLDNAEACVPSQAAKSLKQEKIQDYFVPK